MKRLLIAGVLLIASCGVLAKDKMIESDTVEKICGGTSRYAEAVMNSRQNGVKITESIANVNKTLEAGGTRDYYKVIVYEAYKEPKWSTKENQENAATEFSNKTYLICTKLLEKDLSGSK